MKIIYSLCYTLLALIVAGCSAHVEALDEGFLPTTGNQLSVILQPNQDGITIRNVGIGADKNAEGIFHYVWQPEVTQQMQVLLIMKDKKTIALTTSFKVPATYNENGKDKNIPIVINLPENVKKEDVAKVAGAIGVDQMDSEGNVTINQKKEAQTLDVNDYQIPLYTLPAEVKDGRVKLHFRSYGTLLRMVLHKDPRDNEHTPHVWNSLRVKTSLFSMNGSFNINIDTEKPEGSSDENYLKQLEPVWKPGEAMGAEEEVHIDNGGTQDSKKIRYDTDFTYNTPGLESTQGKPAVVYFWGYPASATTTAEDAYRLNLFCTITDAAGNSYRFKRKAKGPWTQKTSAYSFEIAPYPVEIILTEFTFVAAGAANYFEIYNPTNEAVDLNNFYLYDTVQGRDVNLGSLPDVNAPSEAPNILPAKKTLVIATTVAGNDPRSLYTVSFWHNRGSGLDNPPIKDWYKWIPGGTDASDIGDLTLGRFIITKDIKLPNGNFLTVLGDEIDCQRIAFTPGQAIIRKLNHDEPRTNFEINDWGVIMNMSGVSVNFPYNTNLGARFYAPRTNLFVTWKGGTKMVWDDAEDTWTEQGQAYDGY